MHSLGRGRCTSIAGWITADSRQQKNIQTTKESASFVERSFDRSPICQDTRDHVGIGHVDYIHMYVRTLKCSALFWTRAPTHFLLYFLPPFLLFYCFLLSFSEQLQVTRRHYHFSSVYFIIQLHRLSTARIFSPGFLFAIGLKISKQSIESHGIFPINFCPGCHRWEEAFHWDG